MTADALVQLICLEPSLVITSVKKHANRNPFYPFLATSGASPAPCPTKDGPEPFQLVTWLMELLFYSSDRLHPRDHSKQRFVSYVETQHELSIVFEDSLLSIFPDQTLEYEPIRWKALQVASAGAGAFLNQLSTLTELTTQLARNQISVFQISSYQTDFILVKIEDLDRAIRCLRSFCDVELEDGSPFAPMSVEDAALLDCSLQELNIDPVKEVTLVRQHTLSVPDTVDLFLVQIDKSCVRRHMYELVRLLFGQSSAHSQSPQQAEEGHPHSGKLFLSYSESGEDISVVTSDAHFVEQIRALAYRGEPGVMVSPDCWKVVQIGDKNLGFAETGIVAGHTRVLLNAGTMVFYLSTYATDFMLIKEDEWDEALLVLHDHFHVVKGGFVPLTVGDSAEVSML